MKNIALGSLLLLITFTVNAQKGIKQTERKLYLTQIKAVESLFRLNETGYGKKDDKYFGRQIKAGECKLNRVK